jgi:hypothetical protein
MTVLWLFWFPLALVKFYVSWVLLLHGFIKLKKEEEITCLNLN